jgi:hypothetical protein
MVTSLHGVIVLDNLDTKLLHSDCNGILQPLSDPLTIGPPAVLGFQIARSYRAAAISLVDLQGRLCRSRPNHCCFIVRQAETAQSRSHIAIDNAVHGN